MSSVYKINRPNGVKSRKWYARYFDACSGKWRTKAGYADKAATEALGRRLEANAARRHEGLPTDGGPPLTLEQHLADWYAYLLAGGVTENHAAACRRVVDLAAAACGWTALGHLSATTAASWLADCRRANRSPAEGSGQGKRPRGFGAASFNHYVTMLRSFGRWLLRHERAARDPFAALRRVAVDADRRHVRRSLTADEFNRLVAAAETGQAIVGFTGAHRALLYLLASFTGLRASELASLTKESFRLNAEPATVVVQAAHSKRRRRDVLPIHPSLRERLAPVLIKLEAGEALFPGTWRDRAADLLRADLKAAGIPYQDDEGRVFDLHAIRGQFVTSLARAGVGLAQAQKLARHSTPALTANFYTHIGVAELAGEVGRLPGAAPRGGNEPPPAAGRSDNPASLPFERRIA